MTVGAELVARRLVAGALLFEDEPPVRVAVPLEVGELLEVLSAVLAITASALRLSLAGLHVIEERRTDPHLLPAELIAELNAVMANVAEFHSPPRVTTN